MYGLLSKLNPSSVINLSRYPKEKKHKNPEANNLIFLVEEKCVPSFYDENFQQCLNKLFVVQDLPVLLLKSAEFRDLLQLLRPWNRIIKADDALENRITKVQVKDFFSFFNPLQFNF
jgi:hypothetical protein